MFATLLMINSVFRARIARTKKESDNVSQKKRSICLRPTFTFWVKKYAIFFYTIHIFFTLNSEIQDFLNSLNFGTFIKEIAPKKLQFIRQKIIIPEGDALSYF